MNAKEKYNSIINTIETLIQEITTKDLISDEDIIDKAFKSGNAEYMANKERNAMFVFMTGSTPRNYVSERRMMAAYKNLISRTEWGLNEEYWLSGVETQKGFIQKFEKFFAITPKEAFDRKDESLIISPKTWEAISDDRKREMCECLIEKKRRFGVEVDAYAKAQMSVNLQQHFGLNDLEADLAFAIADENSFDFEKAFEYVYGYVWSFIDPPMGCEKPSDEERDRCITDDLTNPDVINLYFNMDAGFDYITSLLLMKREDEISGSLSDPDNQEVKKLIESWKYWDEHCDEIIDKTHEDIEAMEADYNDPLLDDVSEEEYRLYRQEAYGEYDDYYEDESTEYYESLDEDDPERVEWEYSLGEPNDEMIEESQYAENIMLYDLDDYDDYLRLCKEIDDAPATYRGDESKKLSYPWVNLELGMIGDFAPACDHIDDDDDDIPF